MNTEPATTPQATIPLQGGEQIIWQGRPGRRSASKRKRLATMLLGLLLAAVALAAQLLDPATLAGYVPGGIQVLLANSFVTFVLLILALGFLLYPAIIRQILSRTLYIVTNKRILILAVSRETGAIRSLSPKSLDHSSLWYKHVQGVNIRPIDADLCNLRLWLPASASSENQAVGIMYLPQDVARYIREQCNNSTHH